MYRLDKRRWGDGPVVEKTGISRGGPLRSPLSTADVFWRDKSKGDSGEGDLDNSEVSQQTSISSQLHLAKSEPGMIFSGTFDVSIERGLKHVLYFRARSMTQKPFFVLKPHL